MIDHFGIQVTDLQASKQFYQKTLAPLGYELRFDNEYAASFGETRSTDPGGDFWLGVGQQKPITLCF
ncbi:putative glyoxalase [Streptococcus criceti]|nr:putative glyoxalase [Streptococcus criceti]